MCMLHATELAARGFHVSRVFVSAFTKQASALGRWKIIPSPSSPFNVCGFLLPYSEAKNRGKGIVCLPSVREVGGMFKIGKSILFSEHYGRWVSVQCMG